MPGIRRTIVRAAATVAALFATVGTASAAGPFYASPVGAGDCSSPAQACTFFGALAAAAPGETVLLADDLGYYTYAGGDLTVNEKVKAQTPGTKPEIRITDGSGFGASGTGAELQDLLVNVSGAAPSSHFALSVTGAATADRLAVVAKDANQSGVLLKDGSSFTNGTVWTTPAGGRGIVTGGGGGAIRNVTAISTGTLSLGLGADGNFGEPQTTTVQNSIFRGTRYDVLATGQVAHVVNVNLDHSNYLTFLHENAMGTITDLGGHQMSEPMFEDGAMGNFHQLLGSPTIDAGAAVPGLGPLDFDAGARSLGLGPDIGADEFVPAVVPTPTPPGASPAKKCKKGRKLKRGKCVKKKRHKKKH